MPCISRLFKPLVLVFVLLLILSFPALAQDVVCDPSVDYLTLGNDNYLAGSYQEAVNSFTCALQQHPSSAAIYNGRGNAYRNLGNLQAAIDDYTRAVELESQYAIAYSNRGWVYYQLGQLERALADLNRAIDIDSALAYAYNNRGLVRQAMGEYDLAIDDFNVAIQLGHDPLSWPEYNLDQARFERDKLGTVPTTPTPSETETLEAIVERADGYYSDHDYEKAAEEYGRVVAMDPTNARAYFRRAESYRHLDKPELAIENYTLAIDNNYIDSDVAYVERGRQYGELDQYNIAVEDYKRAIELDPGYARAYFNASYAYGELEEFEEAIKYARLCLENDYSSPRIVYNNLGYYYEQLGDYDQALENYNTALEIEPDYPLALRNRAGIYRDLGEFEKSADDYSRAIELEPDNASNYLSRGILYEKMGNSHLAAVDYVTRFELTETDRVNDSAIVPGDTRSLEMVEGRVYYIPFTGEIGQVITVEASSPDVDTLLVILDPDDEPLTANDDISTENYDSAIVNYELPANGTYTLLLGHAGMGSEGMVELSLGGALSANELFSQAYDYAEQGLYDSAIDLYSKVVEIEPDNAAAFYNRGDAYFNLDNLQAALTDFDRTIEIDDTYVKAYHYRGVVNERLQNYEAALADYNQAIELDPSFMLSYFGRGNAYRYMEQYKEAIAAYDSVLQLDPKYAAAYQNRGLSYDALGEYQKAIDDYDQAMALDPDFNLVYDRANAYLDLGEYDNAIDDYNQALETDPANSDAYLGRGIAYIGLDDRVTAAEDFLKWFGAIQTDEIIRDPVEDGQVVVLEMTEGRVFRAPFTGEAGQVVTFRAVSDSVDSLLVLLGVNGEPLTADDDDAGDLNALISDFELPADGDYTLIVGHAGGGSEGTIELVFGSGGTVGELNASADNFRTQKDYASAIEAYSSALALSPQNAHAYFFRGYSYGETDQFEEAIADYNMAIEYGFSPIQWAYHNRGWSHRQLGEYDEAIADFDRAIEIDPEYGLAYDNRGYTYSRLGEYEKAIEDYTRALEYNPNEGRIYFNRGFAYGEVEEYEKAIADYELALENRYSNPRYAYHNMGWAYRKLGEYEKSIDAYTQAIDTDPGYASAYYGRGYSYALLEDYEAAIADYNKALDLGYDDPSDVYFNRGDAYADLGEWELAKADYTEALKESSDNEDLYLKRGIAYLHLEKRADAAKDFMQWFDLIEQTHFDEEAIADGDTVTLSMTEGTVYAIPFTGETGQMVTFFATSEDADPLLVILSPDGEPLTADDDSAGDMNAVIEAFELPADGTYSLIVGHAGGGSEGTITVTFGETLALDQIKSRAQSYLNQDEYELAIVDYNQILEMEPDNANIYFDRGYSYGELGEYDKAIADYNMAIEYSYSPLEWAYHNRGWAYRQLGNYDKALVDFDHAIELAPDYALAYYGRGYNYSLMDEPEKAVADYNRALDLNYSDPSAIYLDRANAYLDLEEWALAEADYTAVLAELPEDADSFLGRGIATIGLGDRAGAGVDFMEWFAIIETERINEDPIEIGDSVTLEMTDGRTYSIPFLAVADTVITVSATSEEADPLLVILSPDNKPLTADDDDGGDLNALIGEFTLHADGEYTLIVGHAGGGSEGSIEVSLEGEVPTTLTQALAFAAAADYEKALAIFDGLLADDPENAELYMYRGAVYGIMENYEAAVADYSQAIDLGFNEEEGVYLIRADMYIELGEWALARADYETVLAKQPKNAGAYLGRGIAMVGLDDRAAAGVDFMQWFALIEDERIDQDAVEVGDSFEVSMSAGRTYAVPFTGTAGQRITVSAISYMADPLIVILDADGTPLTADDDSGGGLDSLIDGFEIPADGEYTLIVGHAGGGSEGIIGVEISLTGGAGIA